MPKDTATASTPLGVFERYLTIWVALAMAGGALAGNLWPGAFGLLTRLEIAGVNLPVALLIWVMIYPMMVSVDFGALRQASDKPKGLVVTLVINWLVKPFTMAALGVLFFRWLYVDLVPPADAQQYIAGMILLGAAPCTAMVFVWSQMCRGDAGYTLVQVAINNVVMIFAFAPIVALLLGATKVPIPWLTLLASVLLYVTSPLVAGYLTRRRLAARGGAAAVAAFTAGIKPLTVAALLATVALLFAFQGPKLIAQPLVIGLIAVPLIVQSVLIFALAFVWARAWRVPIEIGAPAALIGTSNFFELAVAVAISLYGLDSGAALATVVGVLVEVPIMLLLVRTVQASRPWYGRIAPS